MTPREIETLEGLDVRHGPGLAVLLAVQAVFWIVVGIVIGVVFW